MVRLIEELSLNAWPAIHTILYDGWILRFADGYTRRANSINPLYPSSLDLQKKITACEQIYKEKNQKVIYKITSCSLPARLDEELELRGYKIDASTSIQLLDLSNKTIPASPLVNYRYVITEEWLEAFSTFSNITGHNKIALQQILKSIILKKCFVSINSGRQIIACGLGVIQNGYMGIFDIVTDASYRKKGFATNIMEGLLSWGKANGVHTAYLQVMLNNDPALRLYEKLGFKEEYRYWYRVL
jgi:ribosomal protein S18 acetylase RimI-like enzyme